MTKGKADPTRTAQEWSDEIARLEEIIRALMDRAERSTVAHGSDFGAFQTTVMLEKQVRVRTAELEAALRDNESITRALRESDAKFRSLVDQSLIGIVLIEDGKIVYSNEQFGAMFGYGDEDIRELTPMDLAIESDRALIIENMRKRMSGEVAVVEYPFRGLRQDRSLIDIECHSSVLRIGRRTLLVSLLMDVTLRKQAEREVLALQDRLREQSLHDPLTGLYNRRYLDEFFDRELTLADRAGHPITVIMGDLDHFKGVNDSYGHLAGDEVLRRFAGLMRRNSRSTDICCRYGGEEFLLVLPGLPQSAGVERAERLRQAFEATPVRHAGSLIAVTSSFGVASFPQDGRTADDVIGAADSAMYAAKTGGRNQVAAFESARIGTDQASAEGVVDTPMRVSSAPRPAPKE